LITPPPSPLALSPLRGEGGSAASLIYRIRETYYGWYIRDAPIRFETSPLRVFFAALHSPLNPVNLL